MARIRFAPLLHQLYQTVNRTEINQLSDNQLLERFHRDREEDAFAVLVRRHGPLVLGVCRRVLRQSQDAEDVFQATFLMLARQVTSIRRPGALAGWLYRVAYRLAVKVNGQAERYAAVQLDEVPEPAAQPEPWRDLLLVLDEELHALPEKYRLGLVLCYLEGQTRDQAARHLGWSRRTLLRRLAQGRERLRQRLSRRGVPLPAALLLAGLVRPAQVVVPSELARQTAQIAVLFAARNELVAQMVPAHVLNLAKGGLQTMTKIKIVMALLLVLGATGWGTGTFREPAQAAEPPPVVAAPAPPKAPASTPPLAEGIWADLAGSERTQLTSALMKLGAAPPAQAVAFLKERLHPVKDDPERTPRLIGDLDSKEPKKQQQATEELEYLGKFAVPYLKSALAAKPAPEMRKRIEQIMARVQPQSVGFGMQPNQLYTPFTVPVAPMVPNNGMHGLQQPFGGLGQPFRGGLPAQPPRPMGNNQGFMGLGSLNASPKPPAVWTRAVWAIAVLEQIGTPEARKVLEKLAGGAEDALPTKEAKAALKRLAKRD